MLQVPVPKPGTTQAISLGGALYKLKFTFNYFDNNWRISFYKDDTSIYLNSKVVGEKSLVGRYISKEFFGGGDLFAIKRLDTDKPIGLDNFGIGKDYELLFLTKEELTT